MAIKKNNKQVWLVNAGTEEELGSQKQTGEGVHVNTVQRSSQFKQLQFLKGGRSFSGVSFLGKAVPRESLL